MSTIVRYSSGSTYTIVPNKVEVEKVQDLDGQYHIPNTSIVGMMRLGLGVQRITVSGDALDMSACLWHDVVAISFDSGVSYQTVYFAGVPYTSDCWSGIYPYILSLLASPLREGAAVRYPSSGYKWGNQSITGISQAGNVSAYPTIHYLAPLFYAPLSNTLIDFAGKSVTFTRAAPKTHNGIVYPINTPIFDNGLYLASDTAQDVATWTPPASTLRTIAMQIKMTRPMTGTNHVTNGEFETDTTGWTSVAATVSRDTTTPLVGIGSLKSVAVGAGGDNSVVLFPTTGAIIGHTYCLGGIVKSTAAAGRKMQIKIGEAAWHYGADVDCSVAAQVVHVYTVTTTTPAWGFSLNGGAEGESFLLDYVSCWDLTALFGSSDMSVWQQARNRLIIDIINGTLGWTDDTTTISVAFPIAAYFSGIVIDIVVLDDTAHAVTIAVRDRQGGGSWTSATGTLAEIYWGASLNLGYSTSLQGSIANLTMYPYVLTSTEYQAIDYSSLSLLYNTLFIGNRYVGEIVKGSDKRLLNANGSDISALLGGTDIPIGSAAVTIAQTQGLSARWYVEVKRTDV